MCWQREMLETVSLGHGYLILVGNGCGNNNTSVLEMIADENTVMIKAAHLLLTNSTKQMLKKEKVWQRERI